MKKYNVKFVNLIQFLYRRFIISIFKLNFQKILIYLKNIHMCEYNLTNRKKIIKNNEIYIEIFFLNLLIINKK